VKGTGEVTLTKCMHSGYMAGEWEGAPLDKPEVHQSVEEALIGARVYLGSLPDVEEQHVKLCGEQMIIITGLDDRKRAVAAYAVFVENT
jgi:hypothetical protein